MGVNVAAHTGHIFFSKCPPGVGMRRKKKKKKSCRPIRVVFQDKTMYARTSFRGAKMCKIGEKMGVFLAILIFFFFFFFFFWRGADKLRKTHAKTRI